MQKTTPFQTNPLVARSGVTQVTQISRSRRRSRAPGARNGRSPEQPLAYLIAESFDRRTLFRMDAALEAACSILAAERQDHDARRHIAGRILECAQNGKQSLDELTEAGRVTATELCATHGV